MMNQGLSIIKMKWWHLRDVMKIEMDVHRNPWTREEMESCRYCQDHESSVAIKNNRVVGYIMYARLDGFIHIINLGVAEHMQRKGIGRALVSSIKKHMLRRSEIRVIVWEYNVNAQVFFQALGYKHIETLHGQAVHGTDGYLMQYLKPVAVTV